MKIEDQKRSFWWHAKKNLTVLGVIVFIVVFIVLFPDIKGFLYGAIEVVGNMADTQPLLSMIIFVLLGAVSAFLSFFSTAVFVPLAVSVWGNVITALLLFIGWILGGIIAYFLAYFLGEPIVKKIIGQKKFDHYKEYLYQRLRFGFVILSRIVIPSEAWSLSVGLLRYPFFKYLLANALVELPVAILLTYAGEAFLREQYATLVALVVGIVLFLSLFGYLLHRHFKKTKKDYSDNS